MASINASSLSVWEKRIIGNLNNIKTYTEEIQGELAQLSKTTEALGDNGAGGLHYSYNALGEIMGTIVANMESFGKNLDASVDSFVNQQISETTKLQGTTDTQQGSYKDMSTRLENLIKGMAKPSA